MRPRVLTLVRTLDPWLLLALAVGAFLRFSKVGDVDNPYYTAAVTSMLKNPANFFFASFDPGGALMVDKPPVALWLQAMPVALFGPKAWAVALPSSIAGSLAIAVLYLAIKPAFGRLAAVTAALALAVMPISVVLDSRNEPDSLVYSFLAIAAAALIHAATTGKWRWLLASAALVGIAFNTKNMVAFVPLPAFLLFYVLAVKLPWRKVVARVSLAGALLVVVSFSWAAAVALTPEQDRPYVGSTQNNSIWSLVFGYNGVQRVASMVTTTVGLPASPTPRPGVPGGGGFGGGGGAQPFLGFAVGSGTQGGQGFQGGQGYGGSQFQGAAAAQGSIAEGLPFLRLTAVRMSLHLGWFLVPALLLMWIALRRPFAREAFRRRRAFVEQARQSPLLSQTVLWGGWLITAAVVFGVAESTSNHAYYLGSLAIPLAAVIGIGFSWAWGLFRRSDELKWLLPVVLMVALFHQYISGRRLAPGWTLPVALLAVFLVALGWALLSRNKPRLAIGNALILASATAILVMPASAAYRTTGPILGNAAGLPSNNVVRENPSHLRMKALAAYLKEQRISWSPYAMASVTTRDAGYLILEGVPAVAIGGFMGGDPVYSLDAFKAMADRGEVRFFLMPSSWPTGYFGEDQRQPEIVAYVRAEWEDVSSEADLRFDSVYRYAGKNE